MVELAKHRSVRPLLVRTISENQDVSKKYLENLLIVLKNAGLIRSLRGARGGYVLAKSPEQITAYDIMVALEGSINFIDCTADPAICDRVGDCTMHEMWLRARDAFIAEMKKTTLADLARRTGAPVLKEK